MFVLKLIAIILLFALMLPISMDISEKFANIDPMHPTNPSDPLDPSLFHGGNVKKLVDSSILEHSIITTNKKLESELNAALCRRTCLYDTIKYVEGMHWGKWITVQKEECYLDDVTQQMYNEVKSKLNTNIIYFKLKQYKKNLANDKELLLNFDFVFYNKDIPNAYHVTYISVYNMRTHAFNILIVKVLGTISEDKIHMYKNIPTLLTSYASGKHALKHEVVAEDSFEEMTTHDDQVETILYDKLMASEDTSDDYWKNVEYSRNQKIVRDMFLKDKQTTSKYDNSTCYKNYPYQDDFRII